MTRPTSSSPLAIDRIGKRFGPVSACRDIALHVPAGSITGLLGPNGAGKTTLIRICAGWLAADTGEVHLGRIRQTPQSLAARRHLGIVSADAPLYDELTAREALLLAGALYGLPRPEAVRRADDLLVEFQMETFRDRRAGRLSTGMAQRLRLACALLHQPSVLLLDEPTASLDLEVRHLIWKILRQRRTAGTAILLCTHDFQEAATLCDTVHLLLHGQLTATLSTQDGPDAARQLEDRYLRALNPTPDTRHPISP